MSGGELESVTLTWVDWDGDAQAVYSLEDMAGRDVKNLHADIKNGTTETAIVAQFIDPDQTTMCLMW